MPDSTVAYDPYTDVVTHLGSDWHYHHYLLVLLHHDILHNSFFRFLQRMEIRPCDGSPTHPLIPPPILYWLLWMSYSAWQGPFYPSDIDDSKWLSYYAS